MEWLKSPFWNPSCWSSAFAFVARTCSIGNQPQYPRKWHGINSPPQCLPWHGSESLIPALFVLSELRVQWPDSQQQGSTGALWWRLGLPIWGSSYIFDQYLIYHLRIERKVLDVPKSSSARSHYQNRDVSSAIKIIESLLTLRQRCLAVNTSILYVGVAQMFSNKVECSRPARKYDTVTELGFFKIR